MLIQVPSSGNGIKENTTDTLSQFPNEEYQIWKVCDRCQVYLLSLKCVSVYSWEQGYVHTVLWDNCLLNNCSLEFVNIISLW